MFNRDFVSASSAVGLGALIGGLLSIEIASRFGLGSFLWVFGSVFGGCISYVTVEFKQFCEGVSDAYKKTVSWKPDRLYWKTVAIFFTGASLTGYSFFLAMFGLFSYIDDRLNLLPSLAGVSIFMSVFLGTILTSAITKRARWMVGRKYTRHLLERQKYGYFLLTRGNPVSAPFVALFYIVKATVWMVKEIPEAIVWVAGAGRSLKSFLVAVLKNVHSQKRAIVFFDATAGAVIGYFLGSALVGAFIGALVLYPLHRELVAVRLLKVVPR